MDNANPSKYRIGIFQIWKKSRYLTMHADVEPLNPIKNLNWHEIWQNIHLEQEMFD